MMPWRHNARAHCPLSLSLSLCLLVLVRGARERDGENAGEARSARAKEREREREERGGEEREGGRRGGTVAAKSVRRDIDSIERRRFSPESPSGRRTNRHDLESRRPGRPSTTINRRVETVVDRAYRNIGYAASPPAANAVTELVPFRP